MVGEVAADGVVMACMVEMGDNGGSYLNDERELSDANGALRSNPSLFVRHGRRSGA